MSNMQSIVHVNGKCGNGGAGTMFRFLKPEDIEELKLLTWYSDDKITIAECTKCGMRILIRQ